MTDYLVGQLRMDWDSDQSLLSQVTSWHNQRRIAADRIEQLTAEHDRLRRALHYYADFHSVPSDGPWGVNSKDFGTAARAALKGETP